MESNNTKLGNGFIRKRKLIRTQKNGRWVSIWVTYLFFDLKYMKDETTKTNKN
jgi:hypothetical protein